MVDANILPTHFLLPESNLGLNSLKYYLAKKIKSTNRITIKAYPAPDNVCAAMSMVVLKTNRKHS
ncbi:hypothetical protein BpHYR1_038042 [Brachionus plicatilis]|uniref:Uncharacterized protein n=1 Tax=Brachionus plicatilis TaxID=10195 RepID=A0A3M7QCZ7_BRAPC|nr:hypothetical protein BpHYR1_038042 [Brachionus plicatilis]